MNTLKLIKPGLFLIILTILINSCSKTTETELFTGQIIGYVTLYGITSTDYSGVNITLEGSDPLLQTTTDQSGKYVLDNVPFGTYNVILNKDGYGEFRYLSVKVTGGPSPSTTGNVPLYKLVNIKIDSLVLSQPSYWGISHVNFYANLSYPDGYTSGYFRYFLSTDADVSYKKYMVTDLCYGSSGGNLNANVTIDLNKFPSGTTIYVIVYPAGDTYQRYMDTDTGTDIYTSINLDDASNVASYMIPQSNF